METIRTRYLGELRTEALHRLSGKTLITDAPPDNQGKGESFSPTDLLAAALGSCMMTIMGIAARTHHIALEGTEMSITKIMSSNPRRVSEVLVEFQMPARHYAEKERAILEHAARSCPVALSLHPDLVQTINFHYPETK